MRFENNPLITPQDIKPTSDGLEVACVLNPAVTRYKDQTILLLRVAERPVQKKDWLSINILESENTNNLKTLHFKKDDPLLDYCDPRIFKYDDKVYLTTISHLRIARSSDGYNFEIDPEPFIFPEGLEEEYGVEDARITHIDETYYISYVAVSHNSYYTKLATTKDWRTFERKGIIFPPMNKDAAIFSGPINGKYAALHRPNLGFFAKPAMWLAYSNDLTNWGQHKLLISPRKGSWDSGRIGAGTVPIKTEKGWLEIYHGADEHSDTYRLGLLLLDLQDPSKVLFRSEKPFFEPKMDYEKTGFVGNVVFTNGMTYFPEKAGLINLYYGSADTYVCGAKFELAEIMNICSAPTKKL